MPVRHRPAACSDQRHQALDLEQGIRLLIGTAAGIVEGDELAVDVRGRPSAVRVIKPPFVASHVR